MDQSFSQVDLFFMFIFDFFEMAFIKTVVFEVILEFAVSGLIADGTIQGMFRQKKFQNTPSAFTDSFALGGNHHPLSDLSGTGHFQFGHPLDLDHTHAAGPLRCEGGVIAKMRNGNTGVLSHLEQGGSLLHFELSIIYSYLDHRVLALLPTFIERGIQFLSKFLCEGKNRHGGGITQGTEGFSENILG
jgi:hypothetical protein